MRQPLDVVRRCYGLVQAALRCRVLVPVERALLGRHHDALDLEMVVEALDAAFPADAAVADAAPGRGRIEPVMVVDPDDAGLDPGGDAMGARDVACPDRRGQAEG